MNFDLSASNSTWPLLALVAAGVAYAVFGKKTEPSANATANSLSGLFSGSRITAFMSLLSLASQAGNIREAVRTVAAKLIEWANKPKDPPVEGSEK